MKTMLPVEMKISLKKLESGRGTNNVKPVKMEFHVARAVRDKYEFNQEIYASTGNAILANFHAVRVFAYKMNEKRDLVRHPEQAIRPSQLNAMGLIDEILHYVLYLYRDSENKEALSMGLDWLYEKLDQTSVDKALYMFANEFPPVAVYNNEISLDDYFNGETEGVSNKHLILEEMLMLWISNMNPAFKPYGELFDDSNLKKNSSYLKIIDYFHAYFETQPSFGPDNQNIIDMLRSPAIAAPYSLRDQLEYIKSRWGMLLGKFFFRLLSSFDLISEEDKMRGFGSPTNEVYNYYGYDNEYERFSTDKEWMPKLVLLAKSTLVWLDQLSKQYKQSITRLDQIPDEELDKIASYGFTGIWLIGVWERSKASKTVKHWCGNPDAEASAYSLYDYIIAEELGGEEGLKNLKDRCWKRGVRVASDMVPNHTGIDSRWVHQHPDWFIQLPYPPFPAYSFHGGNLSTNPGLGIYIEDHYYSRSDASVVFKRVDFSSGDTRYIYHGNDGTHMPWNDTAQINFLHPEAREAVIKTIIHVAKMFPIIRFDAAMTLAKKHYQRLWFPVPGSGGDIPSRAEHGMTKNDFDQAIPEEFWREVVDRIAKEVPDTLLLAEAFWLMEGYFVRTLGMHRVYNSAFMNMMKMEDNQKYRSTIKNTMEFDPEILKRFVNFMNNPDEETAVAQFGKDDKYFGVCMMMVTMPGLPMFGHGQIEGYTEKYGMEYRKAYWDETPDYHLVERHRREIFPVMKKRHLFAEVKNFLLYDLFAPEGWVNENVFAYSNRFGLDRGLVLFNNKYDSAKGWIKTSAAYAEKNSGEDKKLVQKHLAEGLLLPNDWNHFCIFRDYVNGLEYIRNCKSIWDDGMYVELLGFKYHVFLDFRVVSDNEYGHYRQVHDMLNGAGAESIDEKLKELLLKPIYEVLYSLINRENYEKLFNEATGAKPSDLLENLAERNKAFLKTIKEYYNSNISEENIVEKVNGKLRLIQTISTIEKKENWKGGADFEKSMKYLKGCLKEDKQIYYTLYSWALIHKMGAVLDKTNGSGISRSWIDEWFLGRKIANILKELGLEEDAVWDSIQLIKILTSYSINESEQTPYEFLDTLLMDQAVRHYMQVNRFQDILWFNKEKFEKLMWWLFVTSVIDSTIEKNSEELILKNFKSIKTILKAESGSDFQLEKLLANLKETKAALKN